MQNNFKNTDGNKALKLIDEMEEVNEVNKNEIIKVKKEINSLQENNIFLDKRDKRNFEIFNKIDNGITQVITNYFFEARLTSDATYFVAKLQVKKETVARLKVVYDIKSYVSGESGDGKVEFYFDSKLIHENSFSFSDNIDVYSFEYNFFANSTPSIIELKTYHYTKDSNNTNVRFSLENLHYELTGHEAFNFENNFGELVCPAYKSPTHLTEIPSDRYGVYLMKYRPRYAENRFVDENNKTETELNETDLKAASGFFLIPANTVIKHFQIFPSYEKDTNGQYFSRPVIMVITNTDFLRLGSFWFKTSTIDPDYKVDWWTGVEIFNYNNYLMNGTTLTIGQTSDDDINRYYIAGIVFAHIKNDTKDKVSFIPMGTDNSSRITSRGYLTTGLSEVNGAFSVFDIKDNKYGYFCIPGFYGENDKFYILPCYNNTITTPTNSSFLTPAYESALYIGTGKNVTATLFDNIVRFYYSRVGRIYTKELNLDTKEVSKERYVTEGQYFFESRNAYFRRLHGVLNYAFKDEI